jgi:serine/threonine protein kinase
MRIMHQVAEGLACAHQKGVIHRDVKPANIMLLAEGAVKIMDFGIARLTAAEKILTQRGDLLGTIRYMSPEQFRDQTEVDARSDIFSYSVMYYELIGGRHPFEGTDAADVMLKIAHREPLPLRDLAPECPEALEKLIGRAMHKERELRHQSLADLQLDAAAILQGLQRERAAGLVREAEQAFRARRLEPARAKLREALRLDPAHAEGRRLWESIEREARRESVRPVVEGLRLGAEKEASQNRLAQAIELLESAVRMDQDNAAVQARLRELRCQYEKRLRTGRLTPVPPDKAPEPQVESVRRVVEHPQAPPAASRPPQASTTSERPEPLDPVTARLREAQALFGKGKFRQAEQALRALAAVKPWDTTIRSLLRASELERVLQDEQGARVRENEARKRVLTVADYRVLQRIGGGFGSSVFRAVHTRQNHPVAIRVLLGDTVGDPNAASRFQRHAEKARGLDHPSVARVLEVGLADGCYYLVTELVEGPTLDGYLQGHKLNGIQIALWCTQIAETLDQAHRRGIAHGNLKPRNVVVAQQDRVKVLDFGLEAGADPRGDFLALGLILYEMAVGPRLSPRQSRSNLRLLVPPALAEIVGRCLTPVPERQYTSAAELVADLREARGPRRSIER